MGPSGLALLLEDADRGSTVDASGVLQRLEIGIARAKTMRSPMESRARASKSTRRRSSATERMP
jgi:hypothetical protein